ncbi:hypothetical protein [Algoriphagus hitonicola]|uniref:Small multi-drug export protein n=1 Tax=Algoriphagus hitonicola TaxID=435880 RepID=A0A1I2VH48_9BACT|nr:hypothetical protein [Algoriphagus hitonicola]SFG88403.1 hypothetical protein SAMN04487988_109199 [Algoriphagus hitonicola]
MNDSLITLFGIYFLSYFKFIAGPVLGHAAGYSSLKVILITVAGMMSSVIIFANLGRKIKAFITLKSTKKRVVFSKKNRRIVQIWKKYGEIGIAFLTPLLLTPIGGTLILVSFGTKKRKIIFHMLWSAILWAIFFSLSIEKIISIPFFKSLLT